jgi:uncharacterized protein YbaR (Trm112 family)/SAM-dependent methyltransferase
MLASTLAWLRCPFCGTTLDVVDNQALVRTADHISAGVLGCQCCAFPVVAGIPVLIADDRTRAAMHALEAGHGDDALLALLGLDTDDRRRAFQAFQARGDARTYRRALDILSLDAEGTYFVYRLSDPTYVTMQALLRALGRHRAPSRVIDVCAGAGHFTRDLLALPSHPRAVVADVFFWKLWLAQTFIAPGCEPVCCDGNSPLPFASRVFDMVVLADAFPYIWHKRMLAAELMRVAEPDGFVVMPHLHSSLNFNHSAGMTLTPAAYMDLLAEMQPRLFRDQVLTDGVLDRHEIDLSGPASPEDVGDEPSVTLIAGGSDLFRRYPVEDDYGIAGELVVNPLYTVTRVGDRSELTLTFPTPEYEEEFGGCRRYMPDSLTLPGDLSRPLQPETFGERYEELRRRRVLLDAPRRYC